MAKLHPVETFFRREGLELTIEVVEADVLLILVGPIEVIPELRRILPIDATPGDGGRASPVVNCVQREILEGDAHFVAVGLRDIIPQNHGFFLANRTLEIAEND